jgi:hypothetical protein
MVHYATRVWRGMAVIAALCRAVQGRIPATLPHMIPSAPPKKCSTDDFERATGVRPLLTIL